MGKFYGVINGEDQDCDCSALCQTTHVSRRPSSRYKALTSAICVDYGFCGSIHQRRILHVDYLLPRNGILTARKFAQIVLAADQMNSSLLSRDFKRHGPSIASAFSEHMGSNTVPVLEIYRAMPWLCKSPKRRPKLTSWRRLPKL